MPVRAACAPNVRERSPRVTMSRGPGRPGPPQALRRSGPPSDVERAALVDPEDLQRAAQPEIHGQAEGQVEDLGVGELTAQPGEEVVVDRTVVGDETLGVLDREALPL